MDQDSRRTDPKSLWALAIGGIGVVVAIVALIFAVGAKNDTNDDVRVTAAVERQVRAAVASVQGELQNDTRSAEDVIARLRSGASAAARTRRSLQREANANRAGVAVNQGDIQRLQGSIDTLNSQYARLNDTVGGLVIDVRELQIRVRALETAPRPADEAGGNGGN